MATRKPNNPEDKGRRVLGRSIAGASFPVPPSVDELTTGYPILLEELKNRIGTERVRTTFAANASMLLLYWDIGQAILIRQAKEGWGRQSHRSAFY